MENMDDKKEVVITKENMLQFKGKQGVLKLMQGDKVLKEFITENVYYLYNTLRSLAKRKTGTYSKLPKDFTAVFIEKTIKQ